MFLILTIFLLVDAKAQNDDEPDAENSGWGKVEEEPQNQAPDTIIVRSKGLRAFQDTLRVAYLDTDKNLLGVVNDTGGVVMPFQYEKIEFFGEEDSTCSRWEGSMLVASRGKYGLVDMMGKPMTALYDKIEFLPQTCKSASNKTKIVRFYQKGKQGIADAFGNVVIRPSYDDIHFLTYSLIRPDTTVSMPVQPELLIAQRNGKYGLFDLRNNMPLLRSEYDEIDYLQQVRVKTKKKTQRINIIKIKKGALWGLMFLPNKTFLPPQYQYIGEFVGKNDDGMLSLVQQKGKWGWIDLEGKPQIKINYDAAKPFRMSSGKMTAVVRKGRKWGIINAEGKTVIKNDYEQLDYLVPESSQNAFFKKLILAKKSGKYGVIDLEGNILIDILYDEIKLSPEKFGVMATKDGQEELVTFKRK